MEHCSWARLQLGFIINKNTRLGAAGGWQGAVQEEEKVLLGAVERCGSMARGAWLDAEPEPPARCPGLVVCLSRDSSGCYKSPQHHHELLQHHKLLQHHHELPHCVRSERRSSDGTALCLRCRVLCSLLAVGIRQGGNPGCHLGVCRAGILVLGTRVCT